MANIFLTANFSGLQDWPGRLLEAGPGTSVLTQTATSFIFRLPATGPFAGFRIEVLGTGFQYDGGVAVDGTMTSVRVLNAAGQAVIGFWNLAAGTLASDFAAFYANVFGVGGDGPGPDGYAAMSHLMSADDVITGTAGNDRQGLAGFDLGNDVYNMQAGDDYVNGGVGNDTINGGDGFDTLSYDETTWNAGVPAFRGVTINVAAGTVLDPWGGTDRFTGIEEFRGSRFNDLFQGDADRNRFSGGAGRDTINGGVASFDAGGNPSNDFRDTVRYSDDVWRGGTRGIVANLETSFVNGSVRGTIRDGFGHLDTVIDIERVQGTRFNDTFNGSRTDNMFYGSEGVDSFDGRGGNDVIAFDFWTMNTAPNGVNVNLSLAAGQIINDGFGNTENAINIEGLIGTDRADSLRGNALDNQINGRFGADLMTGGLGRDTFIFEDGGSFGQGDRITDFTVSGANADRLAFDTAVFAGMTGTLTLVNGTAATAAVGTFIFRAADNTLLWDRDGTGAAAAVAVVRLDGVTALTAANFDLWT